MGRISIPDAAAGLLMAAGAVFAPAATAESPQDELPLFELRESAWVQAQSSTHSGPLVSLSARAAGANDGTWGIDASGMARRPKSWALEGSDPERTRWTVGAEGWTRAGPVIAYTGVSLAQAGLGIDSRPGRHAYAGLEFAAGALGMWRVEGTRTYAGGRAHDEREFRLAWSWALSRAWATGVEVSRLNAPGWSDTTARLGVRVSF